MRRHGWSLQARSRARWSAAARLGAFGALVLALGACVAEEPPTIDANTCNQTEGTDEIEIRASKASLVVGSGEESIVTMEAFCAARSSEHFFEVSENGASSADREDLALGVIRDVATDATARAFMVLDPGRGAVQVAYSCVQPGEAILQVRDRFSRASNAVQISCQDPNADE